MSRLGQVALVTLILVGVVLVLAFPQPRLTAPYTATHGPTTTLRSLRLLWLLILAMTSAAMTAAGRWSWDRGVPQAVERAARGPILLC